MSERDAVLNRECFCITLDSVSLENAIRAEAQEPDLIAALMTARPNLFSRGPVFIAKHDLTAMLDVVAAIEAVAKDPAYQDAALSWAPAIARQDFGPRGVFMSYDFHLGPRDPSSSRSTRTQGAPF